MKNKVNLKELLVTMSEEEVRLIGQTLVWKHNGNLAVTLVCPDDDGENEADMSLLMWQTGRKKALSPDDEELFKRRVTGYFGNNGQRITFGGYVDFFEKERKSDIIG